MALNRSPDALRGQIMALWSSASSARGRSLPGVNGFLSDAVSVGAALTVTAGS